MVLVTVGATGPAILSSWNKFFPGGKEFTCNAEDPVSISGLRRSPAERNSYLLQYSYLKNPMVKGAWWAIVHEVTKSWLWLSGKHTYTHTQNKLCVCVCVCVCVLSHSVMSDSAKPWTVAHQAPLSKGLSRQ